MQTQEMFNYYIFPLCIPISGYSDCPLHKFSVYCCFHGKLELVDFPDRIRKWVITDNPYSGDWSNALKFTQMVNLNVILTL